MSKRRGSGNTSAIITGLGLGIAAGSALGAFVLAPDGGITIGGASAEQRAAAEAEAQQANERADVAEEVLAAVEQDIIGDELSDVPVTVIATPDADRDDTKAVRAALTTAGAEDAGLITLTDKALSSDGVDELGDVVAGALPGGAKLDENRLNPGRHAGQALAAALLTDQAGTPRASDGDRELMLASLKETGFIEYRDGAVKPAGAIVFLAGNGAGTNPSDDEVMPGAFGSNVFAEMVTAVHEAGPVVLAARPEATGEDGVITSLGEVPNGDEVDTVSVIGDAAGRIMMINDLRNQLNAPAPEPSAAPDQGAAGAEGNEGAAAPQPAPEEQPAAPDQPAGEQSAPGQPAAEQ
ncbi:copper transporter [Corynebacterium sp. TAE3-ERU12]|uniref:copper transporter n=1 Tax=Corynebacterium sp. TAE3-ERU12 TaxID=2849491 RepID=UPI001C4415D5|nr:copper transporter [Corynebacterium sp. TAE3-ERU12]MBV7295525.1 copper transporter [Corynebacterium sp. TAE3-ERU12]